jgi:hypothetical protein
MGVFEQFPYTNYHDLNLDWILQKIKDALANVDTNNAKVKELDTKVTDMQSEIDVVNTAIKLINTELDNIEKGQYVQLYLNSLINWIDSNIQQLVSNIVKYVAFGIDDSGYFYADIPTTWNFLQFDTIIDASSPDYGHLTMQW